MCCVLEKTEANWSISNPSQTNFDNTANTMSFGQAKDHLCRSCITFPACLDLLVLAAVLTFCRFADIIPPPALRSAVEKTRESLMDQWHAYFLDFSHWIWQLLQRIKAFQWRQIISSASSYFLSLNDIRTPCRDLSRLDELAVILWALVLNPHRTSAHSTKLRGGV